MNLKQKVLVTGGAGFIGFFLTQQLLNRGDQVVGIDNLNDYYDPQLKHDRLSELAEHSHAANYRFIELDLADRSGIEALFAEQQFDVVVNLGAQAGVRYSIDNPHAYVDSNLVGFVNILEGCRHSKVKHLVYASSSSVYGMNTKQPFSTDDRVDFPISLYAATKKSNELMAHTYSHLYGLPTTGLRFFTVYGPFGRPDMAYFKFTKAILEGKAIDVYNNGEMQRDFTYIDDIVEGVIRVMDRIPAVTQGGVIANEAKQSISAITSAQAPYKVYNIGNNQPVTLRRFITAIEDACGVKAKENLLPMQAGDVPITYADVGDLIADTGFKPSTSIEEGIGKFVEWYEVYRN
ncbi:NAD-dependent epimerase [Thiomicrorhabdus sp. 6S2-11]|uniref:NAD-dependent epimerase n=1 Tax=Thiomicrorhabdus marina TaxID=2818442 RepID=A0ABS3Q2D9_9GAMM|nr:NAD-dependent epimerase [Thiomicrorhabdus marina]MBO1926328.1 NAD-dependent epimerase [Thiomicrorhabdus marina]